MLLSFATVTPLVTTAHAAGPLISQGKPVTASSVENAGTPAANAVDGNAGTRWSSAFADPQWIQVDLGATYAIDQVVLQLGGRLRTLLPGPGRDLGDRPVDDRLLDDHGRRRRRHPRGDRLRPLRPHERHAARDGLRLLAVGVPGLRRRRPPPATAAPANAALDKPATASSTENAGTPASAAVDASTTTRWASRLADPQWIQVDLGSTQTICRVVLSWEAAYGRAYQVQTSGSATGPWTTISSTTTGDGGIDTLTVDGSGRYVRVNGTVRGHGLRLLAVGPPGQHHPRRHHVRRSADGPGLRPERPHLRGQHARRDDPGVAQRGLRGPEGHPGAPVPRPA